MSQTNDKIHYKSALSEANRRHFKQIVRADKRDSLGREDQTQSQRPAVAHGSMTSLSS